MVCREPFESSDIWALDGKFWEVTADLTMGDTAYTNMALGAHTDNTYFVRPHSLHRVYVFLNDASGTTDRSFRTPTLSSPLTHRRIGRRDPPSRRILHRGDPEIPTPRIALPPFQHPDPSTCRRRRCGDLPSFAQIWVPGFEPRPCHEGVVSGEVE